MAGAGGIRARRMQMYYAGGLSVRKVYYDVRITAPEEVLGFRV